PIGHFRKGKRTFITEGGSRNEGGGKSAARSCAVSKKGAGAFRIRSTF
ncbi:hypothetical protein A2U01_0089245, partial [Trifolium medium]|nr:hypothetical protein [Trifolium medium]